MTAEKVAASVVRWRLDDERRATAVAKVTFALSADARAVLVDASPIERDAFARAPRKPAAEILFVGHAWAKGGEPIARRKVRFCVRGEAPGEPALVDKTLAIVGDRKTNAVTRAVSAPARFTRMPIVWERAFGGAGFRDNPRGVGFAAKDGRQPNVLSESNVRAAVGLAPVPLDIDEDPKIRGDFDFSSFLSAPIDQRVRALGGVVEIQLVGLARERDELRCTVVVPRVRAEIARGDLRVEVPLTCDTMLVDGDALTCSLFFRGDVALPAALADVELTAHGSIDVDAPTELPRAAPLRFLKETQREIGAPTIDGGFDPPPRAGDMIPIVNETALVIATFPARIDPRKDALVVVVKGTFDLREGRAATSSDPMLPSGDVHEDGDRRASLRYASDFVPYKPKVDVLLVGSAPAASSTSATSVSNVAHVSLRLGELERRLAVFGDRTWTAHGATEPARFERMPLRWERALGGALSPHNPVGIGYRTQHAAPNLEDPERLLARANDVAPPACFAPIAPGWRARASKLGTYDRRWLRHNWPYFPDDFDPSFFNAAPKEQQLDRLEGGERFRLSGFDRAPIEGKLPGVSPRAFVQRTREAKGALVEVPLRLDTCWFDVDARKLVLVWRGALEVTDDDAPEVSLVYVALDPIDDAKRRLHAALVARSMLDLDAPVETTPANEPHGSLREAYEAIRRAPPLAAAPAPIDRHGEDMSGRDLSGADLVGAQLAGANLSSAKLVGADLSDADLTNADLEGADLSRALLVRARLVGAKCKGAKLVGADLTEATLEAARFIEADLTGARLYEAEGANVRFDRATLRDLRADGVKLARASFLAVDARGAIFDGADLAQSTFADADLRGCSFARADLERADFLRADLRDAVLRRARARRANFLGADLMRATLERAVLDEADLRGANLYAVETWRASLSSVRLEGAIVDGTKLADASR